MQNSYLPIGISFGKFMGLLMRNKGFSLRYTGRVLFLLQGSLWSSLFKWIERFRIPLKKYNIPIKQGPVFIVGHWRTGSTFLHQILAVDDRFVTPSVVQVSVPESFLVSEKYFKRVMKGVMGKKRPMDNVRLSPEEPQEDEYALLKMIPETPLEALLFPPKKQFFLPELKNRIRQEKCDDLWKSKFLNFTQKLLYKNKNAIPLYKNPFHSCRIKKLKTMFPDARFIHIYRHPLAVIPSTVHMWNVVGSQNILKGRWKTVTIEQALDVFNFVFSCIKKELSGLHKKDYIEVAYDDLEKQPLKVVRSVYEFFNWNFSKSNEDKVSDFLNTVARYKKNNYILQEEEIKRIVEGCKEFLDHYKYK